MAPDRRARLHVAVAVDSHWACRAITAELEQAGMSVLACPAKAAEAVLVCTRARPDVVIVDLHVPGMSLEAVRRLRRDTPGSAVVAIMDRPDGMTVRALLRAGITTLLVRSDDNDIAAAVRAATTGSMLLSPSVRAVAWLEAESLTNREEHILELVGRGHSNASIARGLSVSTKTVERHLTHMLAKLEVRSRTEAVSKCRELGLL